MVVRGEVSGTPAGDLFGVAHTGKSFRIMAIDIQTVQDGKISRTYHLENWISAVGQLRAQRPSPLAMGSPERVTPGTERSALTV